MPVPPAAEVERRRSSTQRSFAGRNAVGDDSQGSPAITPIPVASQLPDREIHTPDMLGNNNEVHNDDEAVGGNGDGYLPNTPPPKRPRLSMFKRCFDKTFDPGCIPGAQKVLAPDSDDEGD